AEHIGVLVGQHLAQQFLDAHPAHVGHRGAPLVGSEAPTILSPRWPTYPPPSGSDPTRRDATQTTSPGRVPRANACATVGVGPIGLPTLECCRSAPAGAGVAPKPGAAALGP